MKGRRRIGFLVFDAITALDLIGPMDAFGAAANERGEKLYELATLGLTSKEVVAESGLVLRPTETLAKCHNLDTFVIPGGRGLRDPAISSVVSSWLTRRSNDIRRIASVCTGIYGIAPSGLLDGRSVTTHWRFAEDVRKRFPLLKVNADCIFLRDEKFYTSAGITAGIDLALALIEQDCGRAVALNVARELIVFLKRPGGRDNTLNLFVCKSTQRTALAILPHGLKGTSTKISQCRCWPEGHAFRRGSSHADSR